MDAESSTTIAPVMPAQQKRVETEQENLYKLQSRISVIEQVYFHQPGMAVVGVDNRHSRWLQTNEQPYVRRLEIGGDWKELDFAWLEQISCLVIENVATRFQVMPTKEQRELAEAKIIELTCGATAEWLIYPGESMRACPCDVLKKRLRIRCQRGTTTINLRAFPA